MSSIVVANFIPDHAKQIAAVLHSNGLFVSCVCTSGSRLIHFAGKHYHGGVAVCSVKLRDMPAVGLPRIVGPGYDFLFLVGPQFAGMCASLSSACLMLPVSRKNLISSVGMLLNLSSATPPAVKKELEGENFDAQKTILQAKALLIERNNMTEQQAHRFLQKKSMNAGRKMAETALIVLHS